MVRLWLDLIVKVFSNLKQFYDSMILSKKRKLMDRWSKTMEFNVNQDKTTNGTAMLRDGSCGTVNKRCK